MKTNNPTNKHTKQAKDLPVNDQFTSSDLNDDPNYDHSSNKDEQFYMMLNFKGISRYNDGNIVHLSCCGEHEIHIHKRKVSNEVKKKELFRLQCPME